MKIYIKPLSINQAFKGRKYKTNRYKSYEIEVNNLLKKLKVGDGKLSVKLVFGFSNTASDIDNPVKCFIDICQKRYGFNDKMIYKLDVEKVDVKKGKEYIDFEINEL